MTGGGLSPEQVAQTPRPPIPCNFHPLVAAEDDAASLGAQDPRQLLRQLRLGFLPKEVKEGEGRDASDMSRQRAERC